MTTQTSTPSTHFSLQRWPKRLLLSILFFAGTCLVFLPFSLTPKVPADIRPYLFGGIALALLALALICRRSARLRPYWLAVYGLYALSAAIFADVYLSDWLPRLLGVPINSPTGYGLTKFESMLVLSVTLILLVRLAGDDMGSLLLRRGKIRWWLPIGLAGFLFFTVTVIPAAVFLFQGQDVTWERILSWAPWILLFVLSNGFVEELQFRGVLLPRLTPHIGATLAILLTSLVFSLAHIGVNYTPAILPFLGITLVLGLIFGTLAHKTDSLWGAALFHAGADVPVIVGLMSLL